jgi:hypothetical protein
MKKVKVWIATLSLLLVLTTMIAPTHAWADGDPQPPVSAPQPPPPPPPDEMPWWLILIIGGTCG